jgi:hypothetical protein
VQSIHSSWFRSGLLLQSILSKGFNFQSIQNKRVPWAVLWSKEKAPDWPGLSLFTAILAARPIPPDTTKSFVCRGMRGLQLDSPLPWITDAEDQNG